MKHTFFLVFALLLTNTLAGQDLLYLKLDTTSQTQSMGSTWELSLTTQKYYNWCSYEHYIYNGRPLRMRCKDKSLYYQENIPISQLPSNIKTIEELEVLLQGKSDAIQSAFWESKTIKIIQIHPNGQTFGIISVVLKENDSSGKVSSTQE